MEPTTTVLSLTDNSVTRDQYRAAIIGLYQEFERIGSEHRWCGSRHRYGRALYPEHPGKVEEFPYHYGDEDIEWHRGPSYGEDDIDYGDVLLHIRRRILWYAKNEIGGDLDTANRLFTAMGIPTYPDKAPTPMASEYRVYFPAMVVSAIPPENWPGNTESWIESHIMRYLQELFDGNVDNLRKDGFVPGSMRWEGGCAEVYALSESSRPITIDVMDVERPARHPE